MFFSIPHFSDILLHIFAFSSYIEQDTKENHKFMHKMRKKLNVNAVLFLFWLLNTKPNSTDGQIFGHKDGKLRLSMSKNGKISIIDDQEKVYYQL